MTIVFLFRRSSAAKSEKFIVIDESRSEVKGNSHQSRFSFSNSSTLPEPKLVRRLRFRGITEIAPLTREYFHVGPHFNIEKLSSDFHGKCSWKPDAGASELA